MESIFNVMDISASGLTAERTRMDVISNNIANANTDVSIDGGPYKRKSVILGSKSDGIGFKDNLSENIGNMGVEVIDIVDDDKAPQLKYDPSNPNSNADGFVEIPNVNILNEMVDMISATRAYEANATAIEASKSMIKKTLEIAV
jgi:flagellar basal-body rod protein FlgC